MERIVIDIVVVVILDGGCGRRRRDVDVVYFGGIGRV